MPNKIGKSSKPGYIKLNPDSRVMISVVLIICGILSRTVFHLGNNIELVTSIALLAASFLGLTWAFIVPLVIMAVTDLIIGNTLIFLFTWSAYLIIGLLGFILLKRKKETLSFIVKSALTGILSSVIFYLWTNFGVWALDSYGMYPDNFSGLMQSYIMGIPFFKANLLGNLFFVPLTFFIFIKIVALVNNYSKSGKISIAK